MKKSLLILIFLLAGVSGLAQEENGFRVPDSLIVEMNRNSKPDMNRVEALANIIDYCNKNRQYEKAKPYIDDLTQISEKLDNEYVKALSYLYVGTLQINTNVKEDAFNNLSKGLQKVVTLPVNEKTMEVHVRLLNSFASLYIMQRMYTEAYNCLYSAMEINKKLKNHYIQNILEINMASVLNAMQKYDESTAILSNIIADENVTKSNKHIAYGLLSYCYRQKGDLESSIKYSDLAFETSLSRFDESRILSNMGLVYLIFGQYEKALECFRTCVYDYEDEMYEDIQINSLNYYGEVSDLISENDSASFFIDRAILKAKECGILELEQQCIIKKAYLLLSKSDYKGYSECIQEYLCVRDSLDKVNDRQRLVSAWMSNQYNELETKLKYEKEFSDMQNFKVKVRLYIILICVVSLFIIMTLAYNRRNILVKNKDMELKNKDMELKNRELKEEVLTKEIESRNRELTAKALVQVQRQELLTDMVEKLRAIQDDKKKLSHNLDEVITNFEKYKNSTTPEDFEYYFTQTNPDFYRNLLVDFPYLTPYEQRLCAFLRLSLNTKDIATILNISPESAKVARARLRKRLNIAGSDEDLTTFLSKY